MFVEEKVIFSLIIFFAEWGNDSGQDISRKDLDGYTHRFHRS